MKIGQSAAKFPTGGAEEKSSTTIPVMGSTLKLKTLGEMVN